MTEVDLHDGERIHCRGKSIKGLDTSFSHCLDVLGPDPRCGKMADKSGESGFRGAPGRRAPGRSAQLQLAAGVHHVPVESGPGLAQALV